MAKKKDKKDPFVDPGWGDSVSFSKKAKKEIAESSSAKEEVATPVKKKRTTQLQSYQVSPQRSRTTQLKQEKVNEQMQDINRELNTAVDQIQSSFDRMIDVMWNSISNLFLTIYNIFLRLLIIVFVEPFRQTEKIAVMLLNSINDELDNFNNWLLGKPKDKTNITTVIEKAKTGPLNHQPVQQSQQTKEIKPPPITHKNKKRVTVNPLPELPNIEDDDPLVVLQKKYPHVFEGTNFGDLAKKGIVFLNIKNEPIYEQNKREFRVEEEQSLLERGVKEINNCAKLAKHLPAPNNGKYVSKPMELILLDSQVPDLKLFLGYVESHPKPFIEKKLRLSEAFATWAHKGAPK